MQQDYKEPLELGLSAPADPAGSTESLSPKLKMQIFGPRLCILRSSIYFIKGTVSRAGLGMMT
jgi:hypothetical protein